MNTILTDDERNQIIDSMGWSLDGQERGDMHKLIDAVLAKLARQEPVAWMVMNGVCNYQLFWSKHQADALCAEMQKRHDLSGSLASFHVQPLYTRPAPQQADRHTLQTQGKAPATWKANDAHDGMRVPEESDLRGGKGDEPERPAHDWETRAELAEQQVACLTEERDHFKGLYLAARTSVPAGYKVVPVEPTPEMCATAAIDTGNRITDGPVYAAVLYRDMLAAAPEAPQQADRQRVPEGYVLVPVEPTQEMCKAAVVYANGSAVYKNVAAEVLKIEESIYGEAYTAMLAAAPEAPAQCDTPRYCASVQRCTADDERRASTPAQASAVDERQPLTPERVDELSHEMVRGNKSVNWLVRAIERAHGIGDSALAQKGGAA